MSNFKTSLAAATLAAVTTLAAIATPALAETELVLSSWLPPRHAIVVNAFKPWARDVKKVTDGRVTVRVLAKPLGPQLLHPRRSHRRQRQTGRGHGAQRGKR